MKLKSLKDIKEKVEAEVLMMLAAHRDCLWTRFTFDKTRHNPNKISLDAGEGFYGEAFGIFRGLVLLNYGYFGSSNLSAVEEGKSLEPEQNFAWWMYELEQRILRETGYPNSSPESTHKVLDYYRQKTKEL